MATQGVSKLTYSNGRGLAEVIRIALGAAEIEFEEEFIMNPESMNKLRAEGKLMFNQIPLLEIDGQQLVQTMPILRYICRKKNWLGKDAAETARIDMLSEGARDLYKLILWGYMQGFLMDKPKEWENALTKVRERYFPVFEKELEASGSSGYLVGNSLTMCDIVLLDGLTWIAEKEPELLEEFPGVLNFLMTMMSHPGVQKFLDGPQRKLIPDKEYLKAITFLL